MGNGNSLDMAVYAAILGMSDDELITASFLPKPETGEAGTSHRYPRAPRMRTLIRARLVEGVHAAAGDDVPGETTLVRNVSERGMCLVMRREAPKAGDIVAVRLPTGQEFRAQVRWADGKACGVHLFEKLDVDALVVTTHPGNAPMARTMGAAVRTRAPSLRAC